MTADTGTQNRQNGSYNGLTDRIRQELLKSGEKEVYITIDDLIGKVGSDRSRIYQSLYGLQNRNEIELIKEPNEHNINQIKGVKLLKMEQKEVVVTRVNDSAVRSKQINQMAKFFEKIPVTRDYIKTKLAVEEARKFLLDQNITAAHVEFEENPMGEEAMMLLRKVEDQEMMIQKQKIDLDVAERRLRILEAKNEVPVAKGPNEVPDSVSANK